MEMPDFWDVPELSQKKTIELNALKSDLEVYNKLISAKEDMETLIEMGYEEEDPDLIPEIQEMVDDGQMALNPAVEVSYLKPEEQKGLLGAMDYGQATPSLSQAQRMKNLSRAGLCTTEAMCAVMSEDKKKDVDRVVIKKEAIERYFPKSYTPLQMEETIIKLLDQWQKKRTREQGQDR